MNLKKLQKNLGGAFIARREGRQVEVLTQENGRPVRFRPDKSWTNESDLAAYIKSKVPGVVILPPGI